MEILLIIGGLLIILVVASWARANSYFEMGRLRGMEEATHEIIRGLGSHYQLQNQTDPERVAKAFEGIKAVPKKRRKKRKGETDPYHAQLWIFGDAIGEACWIKGHAAGVRRKAPAEGKFRVDLSLNELLQLSSLAHLGFQNMMPNYRGFEVHRFSGGEDAHEAAMAVSKIESVIPVEARPFAELSVQLTARLKLIHDWWQILPRRLTA